MDRTAFGGLEQSAWSYVNAARPAQALISETLTQVSGFALLAMTSSRPPTLAEAALIGAQKASAHAIEEVRALNAPERARHHLHHLRKAATALAEACAQARLCLKPGASHGERDALLDALRATSDHLRSTAKLIPGFEIVELGQACCAVHAPQRRLCEA